MGGISVERFLTRKTKQKQTRGTDQLKENKRC